MSSLSVLLDRVIFFAFLVFLLWAPLPFASNRIWATALLAGWSSVLLVCWLALWLQDKVRLSPRVLKRSRLALIIFALLPLWVLIQTIPLPYDVLEFLSPRAAELHLSGWGGPISLDASASRVYFLNSFACMAAFTLTLVLVRHQQRAEVLLWVLVCSGLFQAVYGGLMVLSGAEWGFFVKKYTGIGQATGTFVNRNHLAGYLVMTLALGTGLLISQLSSRPLGSWREFARASLQLIMSPKIFLRLFLALMVIALVLTRSRMGNSSFFISLAIAGVVAVAAGRKFSLKLALLLLSLLVVDTWIVGQWFGLEKVVERLEQTSPATEGRIHVSTDSYAILKDFGLTGSGGGSFQSVFTYYQGIDSPGRYEHAHNDYLEIAADLGIPGLLLFAACFAAVGVRGIVLQRKNCTRLQQGIGFALIMVLVWLALHSAVDFNLHIPANSITLSAIFGLAFARLSPKTKG